jgi:NAD(P)H dehydrogenase (quinone)
MKAVIVFNHPYAGSYCNAILEAVSGGLRRGGHEVDIIHLDQDGFDPVMKSADLKGFKDCKPVDPMVIDYGARIATADQLIFIFPIWWELMPALTKGFIDKVIFPGVAYTYANASNTRMKPLWTNLQAVTVITTMNTPSILYWGIFGNAVQRAIIRGTFWKLGYKNRKWINLSMVKMVSQPKREKWLRKLGARFERAI